MKLILSLCWGLAVLANLACAAAPVIKPNIIVILADDLGWTDVGCFGGTFYETPNIDRLATRGVKLTQAYAASPLCSPTRSSIHAGQYPARIGITMPECHLRVVRLEKKLGGSEPTAKAINASSLTRLKSEYFTLAEAFHEAGYATAHFGKWHLGHNLLKNKNDRYEPKDQGFDSDFPHTPAAAGPGGGYLAPWKFITDPAITAKPGEHIENRMSDEAAKYILSHKDRPFYMNYCAFSVHGPWNARRDYIDHFQSHVDPENPQHNPLYAAMVRSLDDGVGRLLAAVDAAGIADNTIIVFFSDNGGYTYLPKATNPAGFTGEPATSNLPLRGGKGSLYEGGTRVPCIVVWPDKIKPGTVRDSLLQSTDFYPTLLAMSGLKPRADVKLDGFDQTGMLLGRGSVRDRVFCHFPHGSDQTAAARDGFKPGTYVRRGDWKLIRFFADNYDGSDRLELYDLRADIGESNNVSAANPGLVAELNALIGDFLRDTGAVVPVRNPNYKKSAAQPATDPLQGWVARACKAGIANGVLRVEAAGKAPFLGCAQVKAAGPLTVKLKIRSAAGGAGKILWRTGKQETLPPEQVVSFEVKPGNEWQDVTVALPVKGTLALFQLFLPADQSPVEIASVDFISTATEKTVHAVTFDGTANTPAPSAAISPSNTNAVPFPL
jgi:arylsulfatase A-like enzyme